MIYFPDNWVVLKVTIDYDDMPNHQLYKVLAGFSGGYLSGDSWKINSGIVRCIEEYNAYVFYGASGSKYHCPKGQYGMSILTNNIYNQIKNQYTNLVELMDDSTHWPGLNYDYAQR